MHVSEYVFHLGQNGRAEQLLTRAGVRQRSVIAYNQAKIRKHNDTKAGERINLIPRPGALYYLTCVDRRVKPIYRTCGYVSGRQVKSSNT